MSVEKRCFAIWPRLLLLAFLTMSMAKVHPETGPAEEEVPASLAVAKLIAKAQADYRDSLKSFRLEMNETIEIFDIRSTSKVTTQHVELTEGIKTCVHRKSTWNTRSSDGTESTRDEEYGLAVSDTEVSFWNAGNAVAYIYEIDRGIPLPKIPAQQISLRNPRNVMKYGFAGGDATLSQLIDYSEAHPEYHNEFVVARVPLSENYEIIATDVVSSRRNFRWIVDPKQGYHVLRADLYLDGVISREITVDVLQVADNFWFPSAWSEVEYEDGDDLNARRISSRSHNEISQIKINCETHSEDFTWKAFPFTGGQRVCRFDASYSPQLMTIRNGRLIPDSLLQELNNKENPDEKAKGN